MAFSFSTFAILLWNFKTIPLVPVPNYWTWTKASTEIRFFGSSPYKIEVMIASLIEMLQLQNMVTWMDLHSKYVFLKRPWVAKFTDIIKIPMILIKTTYEDPNRSTNKKYKEKILQNIFLSVSVCVCLSACLNIAKVNHFFWGNSDCSRYQLVSHVIYTFLYLFYVRYNSVKFLSLLDMCNKF